MTKDEETLIGRIDAIPGWLDEHPDLAEDAEKVARGDTLKEGEDHVTEGTQRMQSLDKAIRHLSGVRENRSSEAQATIDAALERAKEYRQKLVDIMGRSE